MAADCWKVYLERNERQKISIAPNIYLHQRLRIIASPLFEAATLFEVSQTGKRGGGSDTTKTQDDYSINKSMQPTVDRYQLISFETLVCHAQGQDTLLPT